MDYHRSTCAWNIIPLNQNCDLCGKKADVIVQYGMFALNMYKFRLLCSDHKTKWINGELRL